MPTELNPADYLTRGLKILKLIDKNSWWETPNYLRDSEERWPRNKVINDIEQVTKRVKKSMLKQISYVKTGHKL